MLADEDIRLAIERFADAQLRRLPAAPVVAKVLDLAMEGNQHQVLLGEGLRALMRFLDDNREVFRQRVTDESPDWVPDWVDGRVFNKLFSSVQNFLADVPPIRTTRCASSSTSGCGCTRPGCAPTRRPPRRWRSGRPTCWTTRRYGPRCPRSGRR